MNKNNDREDREEKLFKEEEKRASNELESEREPEATPAGVSYLTWWIIGIIVVIGIFVIMMFF